ncbi:MAG: cysteine desulfurase [Armatimonadetes bacterium]|nr:cysteine desulfurase [Armatimonadota bacterium]
MEVYLDHNATTPVRPEVLEAMEECLRAGGAWGNASSLHAVGRPARKRLGEARRLVADALGAEPTGVTFTGSGSEAINLALKGAYFASGAARRHLITTSIEHSAVLKTCAWLQTQGAEVTYLPVDSAGRLDPDQVAGAIREDTLLVSLVHANNEVGTLQPTAAIGEACRERGVLLHVDAVQAVGKLPVTLDGLRCDMLSLSAHKLYGPKGVGALVARAGVELTPLIHGGGQEHGVRSGTEAVAQAAGLARALELSLAEMAQTTEHLQRLRARFLQVRERLEAIKLNGHPDHTLPHTVNLSFMFCDGMALGLNLNLRGIRVSQGSACAAGQIAPSHVLMAMGLSEKAAHGAIRFSLGKDNTEAEIDYVVEELVSTVKKLRLLTAPEDIGKCDENCPCFVLDEA